MAMKCTIVGLLMVAVPVLEAVHMRAGMTMKTRAQMSLHANPIRKVVNLLMTMQQQTTQEQENAQKAWEARECRCKKDGATLRKAIALAETAIPLKAASLKEDKSRKQQLDSEVKSETKEMKAHEASSAEARTIRDRDALNYVKEYDALTADYEAVKGAINAISKGLSSAFIQTPSAQVVGRLVQDKDLLDNLDDESRQTVMQFLQGSTAGTQKGGDSEDSDSDQDSSAGSDGTPSSEEVIGILKQMGEEMSNDRDTMKAREDTAAAEFDSLMKTKRAAISTLQKSIREKTERLGDLGQAIQQTTFSLKSLREQNIDDQTSLRDNDETCALEKRKFDKINKYCSKELVALSEAVSILNNDDALDIFKKTLDKSASSFMQVEAMTSQTLRRRALDSIRHGKTHGRPEIDFIELALSGKKKGFVEVIDMIDTMEHTLEKEQRDDTQKREYCQKEIEETGNKEGALNQEVLSQSTLIEQIEQEMAALSSDDKDTMGEIQTLEMGIKAIDERVAAVKQERIESVKDRKRKLANAVSAHEVLKYAQTRLTHFFNSRNENTGKIYNVNTMIGKLIDNLESEKIDLEAEEKEEKFQTEKTIRDNERDRETKSSALISAKARLATLGSDLQTLKDDHEGTKREQAAITQAIEDLHKSCDWLIENYANRKEARFDELKALGEAKQVLQNFAAQNFLQVKQQKFLGA